MSKPKCAHCENAEFEVTQRRAKGLDRSLSFVCCSSCGVVVGVIDSTVHDDLVKAFYDLDEIKKNLGVE